jgi:hypothetical protein
MCGYMFRPHRAVFSQRIWMEPNALCPLMSIALIDVHRLYSQFWCFENVCSFSSFVLHLLCAPLSVPIPWSCVPCFDLVLAVCNLC